MGRKSTPAEPEKVHRLSLAELAAHDDACSDAMVDNAYFRAQIRKNRTKYNPLRGIKQDEVPQILLHKVICDKDPVAAEKALLKLPGLTRYRSSLRAKSEQDNFLKHLRKYIFMYMTDCPWEVSTTNRYTITTYEAAVTARQRVKQGQVIKYLVGTLVPLTTEESADLDLTNRNFSIVVSSRKKNSSIFLGPARFANHDCDANGRLVTRGSDGMEVVAVKNVDIGDEITVSYGDDYFGPGNVDCLCHTCERLVRNGWSAAKEALGFDGGDIAYTDDSNTPEPTRRKRKRKDELIAGDSTPLRPSKLPKIKPSPSKLQQSWTPPATSESDPAEIVIENQINAIQTRRRSARGQSKEEPALSPPVSPDLENGVVKALRRSSTTTKSKDPKVNKTTARLLKETHTTKQYPSPSSEGHSSFDNRSATDTDTITIKVESVETMRIEKDMSNMPGAVYVDLLSPVTESEMMGPVARSSLTTTAVSNIVAVNTDVTSSVVPSIEPPLATISTNTVSKLTVQPLSDNIRIPGDYILTRKLLAQPHDRWVQCHNDRCMGFFIQPNGYQTRRECPRCERHSMLYGFPWPKTDPDPQKLAERKSKPGEPIPRGKNCGRRYISAYRRQGKCGKGKWVEGGGDEEERVMDHRTVHRFVLPEDEKAVTRKGLLKMAETARLRGEDVDLLDRNGKRGRTESVGMNFGGDLSDGARGSLTPDGEGKRRSNRFVTRVGVYADV